MRSAFDRTDSFVRALRRISAPFPGKTPPAVRDQLILLQHERLHSVLPLLCLTIGINSIAMGIAVQGELPLWQQLAPPLIIVGCCVLTVLRMVLHPPSTDPRLAHRELRFAVFMATAVGTVAGAWCVNAFRETEQYMCVVSPVFIALSALVAGNCLMCAPRAAIAAMLTALGPIVIAMLAFDDAGLRAMAVVLILIATLQGRLAFGRHRETVKMLELQNDLDWLARSDPLTGLDNRRAFLGALEDHLATGVPITIALTDLDGFKAANDRHGHQAGDAVLIGVAERMRHVAVSALSIARLGGDEFALLFDAQPHQIEAEIAAVRAAVAMPFVIEGVFVAVGTSIGAAASPFDGLDVKTLMRIADDRLYADKAVQRLRVAANG